MAHALLKAGLMATGISLLSACSFFILKPSPTVLALREQVYPLPGGLDGTLVFNSNSPEVVTTPGVLLSTLPPAPGQEGVFLNQPFQGDFSVFSHHIARNATQGAHLLYLGLIASNRGKKPVHLSLVHGASYLTQPQAPFRLLPTVISDPLGYGYAGPGDRVATELLHGESPMVPNTSVVMPDGQVLVYNLPVPTDIAALPPANGRSTLLDLHSDGPVYLSEVALFAGWGTQGFQPPTLGDYQTALGNPQLAGPREASATPYVPGGPKPPGVFRYGRVAGVAVGAQWTGTLVGGPERIALPAPGERIGFPLASVYLNRFGTQQNQAPNLIRRYPGTAVQAQGDYGVRYNLTLPLVNPSDTSRTYTLTLSRPTGVRGTGAAQEVLYQVPSSTAVMFRGPVSLAWQDANGAPHALY
ncbi:MAG TPA: DUF3370 family protein, partial [Oscillatoriaceae cyanobacterium]